MCHLSRYYPGIGQSRFLADRPGTCGVAILAAVAVDDQSNGSKASLALGLPMEVGLKEVRKGRKRGNDGKGTGPELKKAKPNRRRRHGY